MNTTTTCGVGGSEGGGEKMLFKICQANMKKERTETHRESEIVRRRYKKNMMQIYECGNFFFAFNFNMYMRDDMW